MDVTARSARVMPSDATIAAALDTTFDRDSRTSWGLPVLPEVVIRTASSSWRRPPRPGRFHTPGAASAYPSGGGVPRSGGRITTSGRYVSRSRTVRSGARSASSRATG